MQVYLAGFGGKLWQVTEAGASSAVVCELDGPAKSLVAMGTSLVVFAADNGHRWILRTDPGLAIDPSPEMLAELRDQVGGERIRVDAR